jgi:Protein of unknown function (DUF3179)
MRTPKAVFRSEPHPLAWSFFLTSALTAIGLFFVPAFIIRPFTHQSAWGLNVAMTVHQYAPWGTVAAALVCLSFAVLLWTGGRLVRKIVIAVVMLLVAFSTVMARLNYFEWMFHPVDGPAFEAESASKLDKTEMVLAIAFGGDARAYPISQMAYHHIVNDVVGGVPVAVTY